MIPPPTHGSGELDNGIPPPTHGSEEVDTSVVWEQGTGENTSVVWEQGAGEVWEQDTDVVLTHGLAPKYVKDSTKIMVVDLSPIIKNNT